MNQPVDDTPIFGHVATVIYYDFVKQTIVEASDYSLFLNKEY